MYKDHLKLLISRTLKTKFIHVNYKTELLFFLTSSFLDSYVYDIFLIYTIADAMIFIMKDFIMKSSLYGHGK